MPTFIRIRPLSKKKTRLLSRLLYGLAVDALAEAAMHAVRFLLFGVFGLLQRRRQLKRTHQ
jgi:hypothetical protein